MNTPFHDSREAEEGFRAMERNAGVALPVLLVSALAGIALYRPGIWFACGSVLSGMSAFLCWKSTVAQRYGRATIFALASVSAGVFSLITELERPLPVLFTVGFSLAGVGLYSSLLAAKLYRNQRSF